MDGKKFITLVDEIQEYSNRYTEKQKNLLVAGVKQKFGTNIDATYDTSLNNFALTFSYEQLRDIVEKMI